jgi:hypothetical protein
MQDNQARYDEGQRHHHAKPIDYQNHHYLLLKCFEYKYPTGEQQYRRANPKQEQRRYIDVGPDTSLRLAGISTICSTVIKNYIIELFKNPVGY